MPRSGSRILDRSADCVHLRSLRWASITSSSLTPAGPSATRTKVPCCHPGLVVSSSTPRFSWIAAVVVLLFLILCCPILALASSRPLTSDTTKHIRTLTTLFVHDFAFRIHGAALLCQRWTPPCSATPPSPKVFTSRPLGTAPANHSTLPNPTRETDVIDPGTPPQPQSIKTITTISSSIAGDLQKSNLTRGGSNTLYRALHLAARVRTGYRFLLASPI
jgi:hypothetical protein